VKGLWVYSYLVRDKGGHLQRGTLEAESERQAMRLLERDGGLEVLQIQRGGQLPPLPDETATAAPVPTTLSSRTPRSRPSALAERSH